MSPIFIILLIIICFWSLITTISAIIKILSNDFKGVKSTWILISMIGVIGPILWVLKGKKLIEKK